MGRRGAVLGGAAIPVTSHAIASDAFIMANNGVRAEGSHIVHGDATTNSDAPSHVPVTPSGAAPSANAAQAMSAKALLYYRKAELCLKRGDLRGAVLQLKLACAADPTSGFLRTALAEVETETRKTPWSLAPRQRPQ